MNRKEKKKKKEKMCAASIFSLFLLWGAAHVKNQIRGDSTYNIVENCVLPQYFR